MQTINRTQLFRASCLSLLAGNTHHTTSTDSGFLGLVLYMDTKNKTKPLQQVAV
jgi:hypothetical protein